MNRTLLSGGGPTLCPSVRERILSSYHATPSYVRCQKQSAQPLSRQRRHQDCLPCCAASKGSKAGKKGGDQGFKGFGEPSKAQRTLAFDQDVDEEVQASAAANNNDDTDEEIRQRPAYQMYTDAGYKAQRYVGPLSLKHPEGEPLPTLFTSAPVLPGELLALLPALGFVTGGFLQVPELEDLHAAMMEECMGPPQRRVLDILDSLIPPPAASTSTTSTDTSSSTSSAPSSSTRRTPFGPSQPLPSLATLDPKFWSSRGRDTSAPDFPSRRLMSLLSRAATADDSQDAACMQARHQKPLGYAGLWPELSLLGHSCAPNTSQLVVADRLLLHATDELPAGTPLTRNRVGPSVMAPLSVRQSAVAEYLRDRGVEVQEPPEEEDAMARYEADGSGPAEEDEAEVAARRQKRAERLTYACRCARCRLEAGVSEELRETLEAVFNWYQDEVAAVWSRANQEQDTALLRGLLKDCETMVVEVEQSLAGESSPPLDEEQKHWLRASVYDVYDLLVTLDELVNQDGSDPLYLQTCLQLLRVVLPGSDNHVEVALKNETLANHRFQIFTELLSRERGDRGHTKSDRKKLAALRRAADEGSETRLVALLMRYGWLSQETMTKLIEGLETYMEGLEQASAMEAQGVSELTREIEVEGVRVQIVDRLEVSEASRVG
ncbi:hypothetical protein Agub_g9091, partial [Astrephomene gubernaculifera]